jgi:hypothetical protein
MDSIFGIAIFSIQIEFDNEWSPLIVSNRFESNGEKGIDEFEEWVGIIAFDKIWRESVVVVVVSGWRRKLWSFFNDSI